MDMEESSAAAAAQGDLADVVARANATASSSSTAFHHHHAPPPPPPLHHAAAAAARMSGRYDPACAQNVLPNYDDERRPQPMSGGGSGGDAVMFDATPVIDPYLHSNSSGYDGLPMHHHHHLAAAQISSQHGCCSLDVDGDEAMMRRRISPPLPAPAAAAQHHHQMMKRKSEVRKVVCIPAPPPPPTSGRAGGGGEAVIPSDLWAWRKYGQKPIKGSPYPRGYYRCSSSKGCLARKQVERSRSDPNMLVITYTAEHNHPWPMQRNVLAGYARAHSTHAAAASSSKIKHKSTDNIIVSSSNNSSSSHHHGGYSVDEHHPELQDAMMVGGEQLTVAAAVGDDGSVGIGIVQPPADEVFAELEELLEEPDNSMVNNNANIMCSKGVSYDQWHRQF